MYVGSNCRSWPSRSRTLVHRAFSKKHEPVSPAKQSLSACQSAVSAKRKSPFCLCKQTQFLPPRAQLSVEVKCSALSRRREYVIPSLGLRAPLVCALSTHYRNVGLQRPSLAPLPPPPAQHRDHCTLPDPSAPACPRTLSCPSWPSAVLPPRPTTASWPLFLAPSRQHLPHVPPRSQTNASETA